MGIQINGQTDTISATDGSFTISGASGNLTGNLTGNVTGNVTGNLTGTASTATAAATAYGISGSPTLSGITSVSTSNLTVNGNAYPNAGPLSNRNLIINGSMQVYQRSGISTNIVGYHLDRWELGASGGTRAVTQETLTTGSPYDEGFRNYFHLINTGTATGASDNRQIIHKIEAQNVAQSGWNYTSSASSVTLSFWVRASVAQTYYVQLYTPDGTAQNYGTSFSLSADTWTKVTKIIPGNSNLTFNNDNGVGLQIIFVPFYGTDFTDSGFTTDAWNAYSVSSLLPDMTNTWAGTTNATFDITGVQLEVGSVATPFEHRSYGDEFKRCCRYYQRIEGRTGNDGDIYIGSLYSTTNAYGPIYFPNGTMRTYPTVSITNDGMVFFHAGTADTSLGFLAGGIHLDRIALNVQSISGTAGDSGFLRMTTNADFFEFNAEL